MHRLSTDLGQNIIFQLTQGKSVLEGAQNFNISNSTVKKLRKKYLPDYEVQKGGCPTKLSQTIKKFCVRAATSKGLDIEVTVTKILENNL